MRRWIRLLAAAVATLMLLAPASGQAVSGGAKLTWSLSSGGGSISSYDYGTMNVGQSASQAFILTNTGGSASGVLTVTLSPISGSAAAFTTTADTCSKISLSGGKTCGVTVRYSHSASG